MVQEVLDRRQYSTADVTILDIGFFAADLGASNGMYVFGAFGCWMVLMTVVIAASLLRKIVHARHAGLPAVGLLVRPWQAVPSVS